MRFFLAHPVVGVLGLIIKFLPAICSSSMRNNVKVLSDWIRCVASRRGTARRRRRGTVRSRASPLSQRIDALPYALHCTAATRARRDAPDPVWKNLQLKFGLGSHCIVGAAYTIISASLSIKAEQSANVIDLSSAPSVCPHIGIVAKWLIGSGCRLGWWVGSGSVWVY